MTTRIAENEDITRIVRVDAWSPTADYFVAAGLPKMHRAEIAIRGRFDTELKGVKSVELTLTHCRDDVMDAMQRCIGHWTRIRPSAEGRVMLPGYIFTVVLALVLNDRLDAVELHMQSPRRGEMDIYGIELHGVPGGCATSGAEV